MPSQLPVPSQMAVASQLPVGSYSELQAPTAASHAYVAIPPFQLPGVHLMAHDQFESWRLNAQRPPPQPYFEPPPSAHGQYRDGFPYEGSTMDVDHRPGPTQMDRFASGLLPPPVSSHQSFPGLASQSDPLRPVYPNPNMEQGNRWHEGPPGGWNTGQ